MESTNWEPIVSGRAAQNYQHVVDAIVEAIDDYEVSDMDWGKPLLHTYLAASRSSSAHRSRAVELVDRAVESMGNRTPRPSLYAGIAGVGWLAAHTDAFFDRQDDDAYEEVDKALLAACAPIRARFGYDLIGGPVGLGVYFLERLPHPSALEGLRRVADELERVAEYRGDFVTWHTPPHLLTEWQRQAAPDGYYNLGVAHGVPGVVGMLAEMVRAGIRSPSIEKQLVGAIRWVLSQRLPDGLFPAWIAPGVEATKSRVAWCYGELGLSLTLLLAARALGAKAFEREALDIALRSSVRHNDAGTVDACLCHGAAGNAHLFNRLFQATRRYEFLEASLFWFSRALEMRVRGIGVAGFRAWKPKDGDISAEPAWQDDASFLTGATGIALAFLAATTPIEPCWDRVLLAALKPVPGA